MNNQPTPDALLYALSCAHDRVRRDARRDDLILGLRRIWALPRTHWATDAGFCHDIAYRCAGLQYKEGSNTEFRTRLDVDKEFLRHLLVLAGNDKTRRARARTFYALVRAFGYPAWMANYKYNMNSIELAAKYRYDPIFAKLSNLPEYRWEPTDTYDCTPYSMTEEWFDETLQIFREREFREQRIEAAGKIFDEMNKRIEEMKDE